MEKPAHEKTESLAAKQGSSPRIPLLTLVSLAGTTCALLGLAIMYFQPSAPSSVDLREATEAMKAQRLLSQTQLREQQTRVEELTKRVSELDEKFVKLREAVEAVNQKSDTVPSPPPTLGSSTRNVLKLNMQDEPPSLSDLSRAADKSLLELKVVPPKPSPVDKISEGDKPLEIPKISINPKLDGKR